MVEACYTARATTKQQVLYGINKSTLQTNKHEQYTHDAILLLQKGIRRILVSQFDPSNLGKGMDKMLDNGNNPLTLVKLIYVITAGSVINTEKKNVRAHVYNWQNRPPYHHLTNGGAGKS
jgi:hypothetical protein